MRLGREKLSKLSIPFLLALRVHSTNLTLPYTFSFKHCFYDNWVYPFDQWLNRSS
jgi:hypothetical protein